MLVSSETNQLESENSEFVQELFIAEYENVIDAMLEVPSSNRHYRSSVATITMTQSQQYKGFFQSYTIETPGI